MSVNSKMKAIADAIRAKTGGTDALTLDGMAEAVAGIQAGGGGGGGGFPNGTEWTQSNVAEGCFKQVLYANGIWVAGSASTSSWSDTGSTGLWYSTDGMTWTQSNVTSGQYDNVAHNGVIWVAMGKSSGLWYSTDGMTWTQSNVTSVSTSGYGALLFCDGIWMASMYMAVYYSTDGMTWTQSTLPESSHVPCYFKDVWVGVSHSSTTGTHGLVYSTDGVTWTSSNLTSGVYKVAQARGLIVACGSDGIWYSRDGKSWTQSNVTSASTGSSGDIASLVFFKGSYVFSSTYGIWYSTDGMTWTQSNVKSAPYKLACTRNSIIAYGSQVHLSTDGKTWTRQYGFSIYAHSDYCGVLVLVGPTSYFLTEGDASLSNTAGGLSVSSNVGVCAHAANGMRVAGGGKAGLWYSPTWLPSN